MAPHQATVYELEQTMLRSAKNIGRRQARLSLEAQWPSDGATQAVAIYAILNDAHSSDAFMSLILF